MPTTGVRIVIPSPRCIYVTAIATQMMGLAHHYCDEGAWSLLQGCRLAHDSSAS